MKVYILNQSILGTAIQHIRIDVMAVALNSHAGIRVLFEDANNTQLAVKNLHLGGSDYASWAGDDNYVKDWVLTQLSFTEDVNFAEPQPDGYQI